MPFELRPLPYANDALGEFMSAETLEFHHGKHHQAYVDKVNQLVEGTILHRASLVDIVRAAHERHDDALFNNGAQMWNHNFFWRCLAPAEGRRPTGRLRELIDDAFGSPENLLTALAEEAAGVQTLFGDDQQTLSQPVVRGDRLYRHEKPWEPDAGFGG